MGRGFLQKYVLIIGTYIQKGFYVRLDSSLSTDWVTDSVKGGIKLCKLAFQYILTFMALRIF